MKLLSFITLLLFCFSHSAQSQKEELIQKLRSLEDWRVAIEEGVTEGPDYKYFDFTPEIKAVFSHKSKVNCLTPRLDFYPIAQSDTIHNRLIKWLRLRSDLFPPSPDVFYTNEYLIFAWELENFEDKVCCNCELLRYSLIRDLKLTGGIKKLISRTFDEDKLEYSYAGLQSIIQQALNLPDLQQYFHIEEDPGRLPLVLEQTSIVRADRILGLKKFGQEVVILDRNEINKRKFKSYLLIDKWSEKNGLLNIQLHYKTEGIFVEIVFEKTGEEWTLTRHQITEY